MIEYALKDANDVEFVLNAAAIGQPAQGSLTYAEDRLENDNLIVSNSSLPGSIKLGRTRLMSKQITFTLSRAHSNVDDFRSKENALIEFLQKAVMIIDKTNLMEAPIAHAGYNILYGVGGHKLSSEGEFTLELLDPFWRAITADIVTESSLIVGISTKSITNNGHVETPPVITFAFPNPNSQLQVYINETKDGIQLDDSLLGTLGYSDLVVDCKVGEVLLEGIDRTESIAPGTGFFNIPIGNSTLKIESNAVGSMSMAFHKRYYV